MNEGDKDGRLMGRDEMNLAEFPITLVTERAPNGCKTLVFEGRHGKLIVTGSDAYGLPTAPDSDVIVGLIALTRLRNDFSDPSVAFTRYELLQLLGWPNQGRQYRRLDESLNRWVGVALYYQGAWWDNSIKCRVDAKFHILDSVVIYDEEVRRKLRARQQQTPQSMFTWSKTFFRSCQADNLKRLDLGIYFSLKSAVSRQLFRFLDKRFYVNRDLSFDLRELAFEHVGLSRNYATPSKVKEKLKPALEELEGIGFLEPMTNAERYAKRGRGEWRIRLLRRQPTPSARIGPEPVALERKLIDLGVTAATARDLVRDFPEERIRAQIEAIGWTREKFPGKIKDPGAYLVDAIRRDHAPPAGFEGAAERARRVAVERERRRAEAASRTAKAVEREIEARLAVYWSGLSPAERARLDAAALAGADAEMRARVEGEGRPAVRRMLMVPIREAYLRGRLDGPAAG